MKPGDIVFWRDDKFGHHRFWEILGVFLGAEGQEGVIELKSLNYRPAHSHVARVHETTFVPEPLLRKGVTVYTPDIRPAP
ncbi:hypothetical protein SAMN05519103_00313 [Rhizobiales bacterium GAS113]|nr:hypothetical protein SAMN05519103_00313 [Rhizobiales bacterium GAS113]